MKPRIQFRLRITTGDDIAVGSGKIDLLEAIALAGGYTRIAAPERITVRRQSGNGDQIFKVNAKKFNKGNGGGFRVEPGDTITVGESIF